LADRVNLDVRVVNTQNRRQGIKARRGDGTFGEKVPGETGLVVPGFLVHRGLVATVEIGCEVKIMAKAMIKQIDRVISDLQNQTTQFRRRGGNPICVGIVGVNFASYAIGYEKDREYRTDGRGHRHPIQEASETVNRLTSLAAPAFDEFLILRYRATNDPDYGFPFHWNDIMETRRDYGAILTRVSIEYERRF
jgi:hypothetical protein